VGASHLANPRSGRVDRDVFATIDAAPTPLGEALAALAAAAVTVQARLAPHLPHWTLIGRLTLRMCLRNADQDR